MAGASKSQPGDSGDPFPYLGMGGDGPARFETYPDVADIASRISFDPATGHIWLHDERMVLLHGASYAEMRRALIDGLGMDKARETLTRIGYEAGAADARLGRKLRGAAGALGAFAAGPQLLAIQGFGNSAPVKVEMEVERGHWYGDFLWPESFEAEAHIARYGIGAIPACWFEIGYASGYTSAFMGRPILYREIECRALGHARCRCLGKPVERWDGIDDDLRFFRVEDFTRFARRDNATEDKRDSAAMGRHGDAMARGRSRRRGGGRKSRAGGARARLTGEGNGATGDMIGASAGFAAAVHLLKKVATTDATTLFLGESGVGKEIFSRTLHRIGRRRDKPFIAVNCAAIPEELIEAELFGVERGAFTGAVESRPGRFERADGGTLFLDEIATLSFAAQGKLLRALQEGEIERVGDHRLRNVDVRVIAATNIDLKSEVAAGRFRQDLYYRLNVFPIPIPPLRERRADIPLLMDAFLEKFTLLHGRRTLGFSEEAVEALLHYDWPGNIRELENMIERGVILAPENGVIQVYHLFTGGEYLTGERFGLDKTGALKDLRDAGPAWRDMADRAIDGNLSVEAVTDAMVDVAVERAGGNLSAASRLIGLTRAQIAYRLEKRGARGAGS